MTARRAVAAAALLAGALGAAPPAAAKTRTFGPRLTKAADHSKLWFAIAAGLAAFGNPSVKRGAMRGVMTLGVTSLVTNQGAKRVWRRERPSRLLVPLARQTRRAPTSNSLPSGHSASAAAFRRITDR